MTTEQTAAPDVTTNADDTRLWVERTGVRRYTGRNSRGAEVLIGGVGDDGAFSPGELLKIALAGCSGLSSDSALAHRLGDDVDVTINVSGMSDDEEDRYPAFAEELVVDLSALDARPASACSPSCTARSTRTAPSAAPSRRARPCS